tara:strand:+ start:841 stop:1347 length:507 start_codon:yes stop_codon:yes gene_type:complete
MNANKTKNKNFYYLFLVLIFLMSCSQKNKIIDLDLSNLPKPKIIKSTEDDTNEITQQENKEFIKDLEIFKSKDKLLSKFKIGKKDPFSQSESKLNQFSSKFELSGFLNTESDKYVFVSFLGNEGTISEDSIGGLNTNLLPDGAKVINIDNKKMQLKIRFNDEDYIFEL